MWEGQNKEHFPGSWNKVYKVYKGPNVVTIFRPFTGTKITLVTRRYWQKDQRHKVS